MEKNIKNIFAAIVLLVAAFCGWVQLFYFDNQDVNIYVDSKEIANGCSEKNNLKCLRLGRAYAMGHFPAPSNAWAKLFGPSRETKKNLDQAQRIFENLCASEYGFG